MSVETRVSDLALGALALVLGLVAILGAPDSPARRWEPAVPELFQTAIGGLLLAIGLVLLARGVLFERAPAKPWRPAGVALVAGMLVWRTPAVIGTAAAGMRVAAAITLAAACFAAYPLSARAWDVGAVLVLGLFGVACKLLGWNRLVLIIALERRRVPGTGHPAEPARL